MTTVSLLRTALTACAVSSPLIALAEPPTSAPIVEEAELKQTRGELYPAALHAPFASEMHVNIVQPERFFESLDTTKLGERTPNTFRNKRQVIKHIYLSSAPGNAALFGSLSQLALPSLMLAIPNDSRDDATLEELFVSAIQHVSMEHMRALAQQKLAPLTLVVAYGEDKQPFTDIILCTKLLPPPLRSGKDYVIWEFPLRNAPLPPQLMQLVGERTISLVARIVDPHHTVFVLCEGESDVNAALQPSAEQLAQNAKEASQFIDPQPGQFIEGMIGIEILKAWNATDFYTDFARDFAQRLRQRGAKLADGESAKTSYAVAADFIEQCGRSMAALGSQPTESSTFEGWLYGDIYLNFSSSSSNYQFEASPSRLSTLAKAPDMMVYGEISELVTPKIPLTPPQAAEGVGALMSIAGEEAEMVKHGKEITIGLHGMLAQMNYSGGFYVNAQREAVVYVGIKDEQTLIQSYNRFAAAADRVNGNSVVRSKIAPTGEPYRYTITVEENSCPLLISEGIAAGSPTAALLQEVQDTVDAPAHVMHWGISFGLNMKHVDADIAEKYGIEGIDLNTTPMGEHTTETTILLRLEQK